MKAVIYKIYCKDSNIVEVFVGHTINFKRRQMEHRVESINGKDTKLNVSISKNGGWDNWIMEEIEEIECNNKTDILEKKKYYIRELNATLNTNNGIEKIKTDKQICKEKSLERKKLWLESNR